jgi:hypothetical protein
MPFQNNNPQPSPFEITTSGKSKKVGKTGVIVGVSIAVFLVLSVVAGVLLVRQQQNIQEKAVGTCTEACPAAGRPDLLQSCHPADSDGTANESLCNLAGRVETCGPASTKYCCPSAGGAWTTNMSACATPTPTATATPPSCGSVVPNCAQTQIPGSAACFDGKDVVYCCKAGQQIQNNSCVNGGVTKGGLCDPSLSNGGCVSGLICTPSDGANRCSDSASTSSPTPTATATSSGNSCNKSCGSNSNCQSGLYCYSGSCRNPLCASDSTCGCSSATATPTPTATTTTTTTTTTKTTQATSRPIPVTGTDWPTIGGIGVGIGAIMVSLLLAL